MPFYTRHALLTMVFALWGAPLHAAEPVSIDHALLQTMQETIRQQQLHLQQQAEQIRLQSQKLEALQQQVTTLQQTAPPIPVKAPVAATDKSAKPLIHKQLAAAVPPVVTSGNDRIRLAISGQLNRAMNVASDGVSTRIYHVDNDGSNSRFRLVGSAKINDDLSLGTRIEIAVAPDISTRVSQTSQVYGDYFNQRWAEVSLASKRFGKLSIGKGDTASNTTAEADLSKTSVVQYSQIYTMAGGMLFREKNGARALTSLKISDVFNNGDGLTRQSRLRYDSPGFYGFSLAGSLVAGQRSDIALYWGGEGYGFQGGGAFAVANTKGTASYSTLPDARLLYDGSFSLLHKQTGLNVTVSGSLLERTAAGNRTNLYTKLGWIAHFTRLGSTAFGLDYTRTSNGYADGDRATSVGAAVVQAFEQYATELYVQYRIHALERSASLAPVSDINVGTVGVRVKF
ncbi:MAG: porin [Geobacter sp.]|nr:porin [Geobacter sp.]